MMPPRNALVWLAAGIAALSIGLAALPLPRRFAGDSGLPPPSPDAPGPAPADVSVESILAWSPFGRAAPTAAPAQETSLGLTLHGVVIATDPEASSAIVSGAAPVQSYAVGQEVAAGATLAEVHRNHVVLLVEGRLETLAFPEDRREAEPDSGAAALRALVTAPAPVEDPDGMLADYRERLGEDPQAVLDELGLVATGEGYRVAEGASEALLQTGLQPGDLLVKINEQQVGNIEQDLDLFDEVTAAGRARMEVMRDGRRVLLSFP